MIIEFGGDLLFMVKEMKRSTKKIPTFLVRKNRKPQNSSNMCAECASDFIYLNIRLFPLLKNPKTNNLLQFSCRKNSGQEDNLDESVATVSTVAEVINR